MGGIWVYDGNEGWAELVEFVRRHVTSSRTSVIWTALLDRTAFRGRLEVSASLPFGQVEHCFACFLYSFPLFGVMAGWLLPRLEGCLDDPHGWNRSRGRHEVFASLPTGQVVALLCQVLYIVANFSFVS